MTGRGGRTVRTCLTQQQRTDLKYAYERAMAYARGVLKLEKRDAEDVVQAASLRALERIAEYEPRLGALPFVAWLKTITLNLVRDEHRKREREDRLKGDARDATTSDAPGLPDLDLANARAKVSRDRVLAMLTERARAVFEVWVQTHAGHFNRAEASQRLGCSIDEFEAAKKRVRRELEDVMKRLDLTTHDLMSELPRVANAGPTRGRREEGAE